MNSKLSSFSLDSTHEGVDIGNESCLNMFMTSHVLVHFTKKKILGICFWKVQFLKKEIKTCHKQFNTDVYDYQMLYNSIKCL